MKLYYGDFSKHKTQKVFLHLELGTTPLRWILAQTRLNYLKHISSRDDSELIDKVCLAQKETLTQGYFFKFIEKDLKDLNITYVRTHIDSDLKKIGNISLLLVPHCGLTNHI